MWSTIIGALITALVGAVARYAWLWWRGNPEERAALAEERLDQLKKLRKMEGKMDAVPRPDRADAINKLRKHGL